MNCLEFRQALETSIEERTSAGAELQQHAEQCQNSICRELWQATLLLATAIPAWKTRYATCVDSESAVEKIWPRASTSDAFASLPTRAATPPRPGDASPINSRSAAAIAVALAAAVCVTLSLFQTTSQKDIRVVARSTTHRDGASSVDRPEMKPGSVMPRKESSLPGDWIANASAHVSDSVTYVLLGPSAQSSETSESSDWLRRWNEPLKPLEEDLEILRDLLLAPSDQRTQTTKPLLHWS